MLADDVDIGLDFAYAILETVEAEEVEGRGAEKVLETADAEMPAAANVKGSGVKKVKRNAAARKRAREHAEQAEWETAVYNFASFHCMCPAYVLAEEVLSSSAGIRGWAEAHLDQALVQTPGSRIDSPTLGLTLSKRRASVSAHNSVTSSRVRCSYCLGSGVDFFGDSCPLCDGQCSLGDDAEDPVLSAKERGTFDAKCDP